MTHLQHNTRGIAMAFLILVLAGTLFVPQQNAEATVPTHCSFLDFNCIKEGLLDTAAKAIMKKIIRQLRAATINWILTGDFEIKKPFFVTSFIADPQRIADNAARLFLSELTGINFCKFHPNLRSAQNLLLNIDLNLTLSCNPNLGGRRFSNRSGGLLGSTMPSANFSTVMRTLRDAQSSAVHRQISAFAEEVRTNSGFLGQRDPKTGKIKTPGNLIAETLIGSQNSEMFGQEVNQEIFSAIVDVIDTAIGKTIQDGILGKF